MTDSVRQTYRKLVVLTLIAEAGCWLLALLAYSSSARWWGSGSLKFLHPGFSWGFLIVPVLLFTYIRRWEWKSRLYEKYRGMGNTRMLWIRFKPLRYFLQYFFLRNIVFFLVLALMQPAMGSSKVKASRRVLDLVICLDISSSMNVQDLNGISRLEVAKRGIAELLNNLSGERIAVVVFANSAYTQLPLTMDYGAAKMFTGEIETDMISDQGTNIGDALRVAQEQFIDGESGHAILVITDGEDHALEWKQQIAAIRKKGIELSYYGIGTERGGLIPNDPQDSRAGYKREGASAIVSRLDRQALKRMASATNSSLYFTESAFPDMSRVIKDLSAVKTREVRNMEFMIDRNYYKIPLVMAFIFLLGYLFVPFLVNRSRS